MSGPPPPPPPHGGVPKGSGLPPGKYDIFVIPEHSAGAGFLYLPSLQPNINSFAAGFASALILVALFQSMAPAFRAWWDGFQGLGNMGMAMIVLGVGFGAWSLGRVQQGGSPPKYGPSTSYDGTGGYGGTSSRTSADTGAPPPPPHGNSTPPPPPPHNEPPPQPPPQQERHKNTWEGPPPQQTPPPPQSEPRQQPPPPPQTPPETPPQKPQPKRPPTPQSTKAEPTQKSKESAWEKAREETKRKEAERKAKEAEQKRREEAARRLADLRAREARERAERDKERQRREREIQEREEQKQREAKERRERLEAEQRAKDLAEKLEHERRERERFEREAKEAREAAAARAAAEAKLVQEAKEREAQKQREAKELEEKRKRDAQEREERRKRLQQQREEMRKREAEEAKRREEAKKKKEDEEKSKAEAEAKAEVEAQTQARKGSSYAFSSVGERTSMWPNGRPPVPKSNVSSPTPKPPPSAAPSNAPSNASNRPPAPTTPRSNVSSSKTETTAKTEETHSYRPYDKIRARRKKSVSSMTGSESSWAGTQTTSRTSPPPSVRGPYTTSDPDKIVISAVYLFMNQYAKTPASQLISGVGSVTDGLILRITTEGLFIDDDMRGVPQREWDVKAWTLNLTEVWCPPHCLNEANKPPPAAKANPLLFKMTQSRARDRGGTKPLLGEEADTYLADMLKACKDCCKLGLCERKFQDTKIPSSASGGGDWKAKGLHLLRATVRDQEGKRYVFVVDETEGWKLAMGLQRLRRGTQVRQLGLSGLSPAEARGSLEMLGWGS